MKRYFQVYRECIRISFASAAAYRTNFVLSSIIMLVSNLFLPLLTVIIYESGASFPGWNVWEVLLIQSVFTMANGVASMFFNGVLWATMRLVQYGEMEVILIRPMNLLFYLMASTFDISSWTLVAGGLALLTVSLVKLGGLTLTGFAGFLLLFAAGLLVLFGIALLMAATSFKWVANSRIPEIFDSLQTFGKYPMTIFPKAVQGIFSFIIPVAMIGYFPASVLLGKADGWMFPAVIPCLLFAAAGILVYHQMMKLYEGVGG